MCCKMQIYHKNLLLCGSNLTTLLYGRRQLLLIYGSPCISRTIGQSTKVRIHQMTSDRHLNMLIISVTQFYILKIQVTRSESKITLLYFVHEIRKMRNYYLDTSYFFKKKNLQSNITFSFSYI